MATLEAKNQLTLLELAKRHDPNGDSAAIAEVLEETNEILQDAIYLEANDKTSNKSTRRLTLPTGTWRKLNKGVGTESSQTVEQIDNLGMLESFSKVDKALADRATNPMEFRNNEALAFVEGLGQTFADTLVYGNDAIDTEQFTGLAPRLASLVDDHVVSAGGSGSDLTSIYVVQWGERMVHMVYPQGDPHMGIMHDDLGVNKVLDDDGNGFMAYEDHFKLQTGLVVRDERCIARNCNIEVSGSSNLFDEDDLIAMLNELPFQGRGAVIYVNKKIKTQMQIRLKNKANVNFSVGEGLSGRPVLFFDGVPVHRVDAITNTESEIT